MKSKGNGTGSVWIQNEKRLFVKNSKHIKTTTHINATTKGDEPKRDAVNDTWMSEKWMRLAYQMIYIK